MLTCLQNEVVQKYKIAEIGNTGIWMMKFKFKLEWYLSIKVHCLALKKGPTHAYISLDRLWLRHTFAVALFWQAYEMSHHWFPSRVAKILAGWCVKSSPARFSVGSRSGLCGGQSMCENDVSCSLNQSFITWAWWIVALSFWNMTLPSGKNKSTEKNWSV